MLEDFHINLKNNVVNSQLFWSIFVESAISYSASESVPKQDLVIKIQKSYDLQSGKKVL